MVGTAYLLGKWCDRTVRGSATQRAQRHFSIWIIARLTTERSCHTLIGLINADWGCCCWVVGHAMGSFAMTHQLTLPFSAEAQQLLLFRVCLKPNLQVASFLPNRLWVSTPFPNFSPPYCLGNNVCGQRRGLVRYMWCPPWHVRSCGTQLVKLGAVVTWVVGYEALVSLA